MSNHVVLIGLMGSGKSTVGRRLAKRLGRTFVDTDARIETSTGRRVREVFQTDGESTFRDIEASILREILDGTEPSIVAGGGGIILREENRRLLTDEHVIWLRAAPSLLAQRLSQSARRGVGHRPLIDDDPLGTLTSMHESRSVFYAEVSDDVIDVDDLSPDQVVEECKRSIERRAS